MVNGRCSNRSLAALIVGKFCRQISHLIAKTHYKNNSFLGNKYAGYSHISHHRKHRCAAYGLFHAIAQPAYSWGVIRKVSFPGVNLDIGHIRPIGYSKDNDQNTWIAYNKLRGQYMSALEHAIPERFFNDPTKCNPQGTTTPVAGLPECPQGISAVKAIGIAASQGQKIYTITKEVYAANPSIVSTALSAHSYSTQQAVQAALGNGHEVTIHEKPITQSGWTGAGYIYTDTSTGAGVYY